MMVCICNRVSKRNKKGGEMKVIKVCGLFIVGCFLITNLSWAWHTISPSMYRPNILPAYSNGKFKKVKIQLSDIEKKLSEWKRSHSITECLEEIKDKISSLKGKDERLDEILDKMIELIDKIIDKITNRKSSKDIKSMIKELLDEYLKDIPSDSQINPEEISQQIEDIENKNITIPENPTSEDLRQKVLEKVIDALQGFKDKLENLKGKNEKLDEAIDRMIEKIDKKIDDLEEMMNNPSEEEEAENSEVENNDVENGNVENNIENNNAENDNVTVEENDNDKLPTPPSIKNIFEPIKERIEERIKAYRQKVGQRLINKLEETKSRLEGAKSRLEEFKGKNEKVDEKIERIEERIDKAIARIDKIIEKIKERFDLPEEEGIEEANEENQLPNEENQLPKEEEYDFGDYSSAHLIKKSWEALNEEDYEAAKVYAEKCIELYEDKAKEQQASLNDFPSSDEASKYWALNDVGTAYFILAESYRKEGDLEKAKEYYQKIIDEYSYAQCWDTQGWWWKVADAAKEKLEEIEGATAELSSGENQEPAKEA